MSSCLCGSEAWDTGSSEEEIGSLPEAGRESTGEHSFQVTRLQLTDFRNHKQLLLSPTQCLLALVGPNGSGKTNILEALSLLAPGRGLRRAPLEMLARKESTQGWAISAQVTGPTGSYTLGTGQLPGQDPARRAIRIEKQSAASTNALSGLCPTIWITPAMDGLFTAAASERRRFFDRLVLSLIPTHKRSLNAFETSMRQRNSLLENRNPDGKWLDAVETEMASHAVAIAAARRELLDLLRTTIQEQEKRSLFPATQLALEGTVETLLSQMPAISAEDQYLALLRNHRRTDAQTGRTRFGPHRSDLVVSHAEKAQEARYCSTGEQKILLISLILSHMRTICKQTSGAAPILLLDEVTAHLDRRHRAALFTQIRQLGTQTWMSGTDPELFSTAQIEIFPLGKGRSSA